MSKAPTGWAGFLDVEYSSATDAPVAESSKLCAQGKHITICYALRLLTCFLTEEWKKNLEDLMTKI